MQEPVNNLSRICNRMAVAAVVTFGSTSCTTTKNPRGPSSSEGARVVKLYSNHLRESATVSGDDDPDLDMVCRDRRDNKVKDIDPKLYRRLVNIQAELNERGYEDLQFNIVSCFRSPETNEFLRQTRGGQAKKSTHIEGKAIDIQVTATYGGQRITVPLNDVWESACEVRNEDGYGGLGYYAANQFIHSDVREGIITWNKECPEAA